MTETLFYHLERRGLDDVLPELVERSLARGWRAVIRTESAERAEAIDNLLWTYDEQSFLPHARTGDGDPANQPVLITVEEAIPNSANILFLVGGAVPSGWSERVLADLSRIVLMFDGRDPEMLSRGRSAWKAANDAGHEVTYWKESGTGKWEQHG